MKSLLQCHFSIIQVALMVDIHSHILPGLDDGSQSLEDSIAMVKMAAESGTTGIVATPHASRLYSFNPDAVAEHAAELAAAVPGIRIYTGCDFHLNFDNIQDALRHPQKYTINQKQYLLVEFPDMITFNTTPQIFGELQRARMIPIVTHPERNTFLQENIAEITKWVAGGACIQVTAQSFLGVFGRRAQHTANDLTKRGLVHFVASDAHDLTHRTTSMRESFDYVAAKFGKDVAESLFINNPEAAVAGDPLPEPVAPKPKPWFQFWR
jgi:protein-tyrosine phosphatase